MPALKTNLVTMWNAIHHIQCLSVHYKGLLVKKCSGFSVNFFQISVCEEQPSENNNLSKAAENKR